MSVSRSRLPALVFALVLLWSCAGKKKIAHPFFEGLPAERTGLDFSNTLQNSPAFNLFRYMYFYNGSGVGAGDFNNDGKTDLFFGSNQGQNKLYVNKGGLRFSDVTTAANIPHDGGWTTGISVVDVNNDGWLDVYVCRVGHYEVLQGRNQLLVNEGAGKDGVPRFTDRAKEYGLDFSGFGTQAAFFDYDNDGDLDVYLLNHSVHQSSNFRPRADFEGTYDSLSGDRIFRNDLVPAATQKGANPGRFTDVTRQSGIRSTSIGYGLGVAVSDVNLDGYPDVYIANDFHENDYLYINQKNGSFRDEAAERLMHTSQYSMGVDAADVDNDAYPEIITVDMLAADPYILKRSLGENTYDVFNLKLSYGYSCQYSRNNLQYNRANGLFSETGLFSGVAATDWSWAPLWFDFDNDGLKDLFVSNGIPKRMNDIDYINYISTAEVQQKINSNSVQAQEAALIGKFPEIRLPNKFYRNNGNLSFRDVGEETEGNLPGFSNGAVYADFDNDGDLDVVVNNIDAPVQLYENKCAAHAASVQVKLAGPENNRNAVGAKLLLFSGTQARTVEKFPARGFLSSMEIPLHLGTNNTVIDSALVIWPDRTYENVQLKPTGSVQTLAYKKGLPVFDFARFHKQPSLLTVEDLTGQSGLLYRHRENRFVEFDREPLLPHVLSSESPCAAVADINHDGVEDVFLGGARDSKAAVFLQATDGKFHSIEQPSLEADSSDENTDACWADVNNDGHPDLVVASGGNEFFGHDEHNSPRVYLNNGDGGLTKLAGAFGPLYLTASCIVPNDVNGDGYVDFFIGGRAVPWAYGAVPRSYLVLNNGNGTFRDATADYTKDLGTPGFVTGAVWCDLDGDSDKDLVLALEWDGIVAYMNNGKTFSRKMLTAKKGWWNFVLPFDADGDGDLDVLAGNLGLNSRLKASDGNPVRLYYNDFDGNGKKEQVLTYYVNGKEIPFASKAELEKQLPVLKKKFLYAEDLAKASLPEIFGKQQLEEATVLTADFFESVLLLNNGKGGFEAKALPWPAQLTAFRNAVLTDANGDILPDVLLTGNYYESNVELGRYDADFGTLLVNRGGGNFSAGTLGGMPLRGQVRRMLPVQTKQGTVYVVARNNDSTLVVRLRKLIRPVMKK